MVIDSVQSGASQAGEAGGPGQGNGVTRTTARLLRVLRAHLPFAVIALAAAVLRVIVMLGYPAAMFFNDSYSYMAEAVTGIPGHAWPNGYPFLLRVLLPLHSLAVVTGLQALLGLAMGIGIYAVLRRRGLPWWGASICAGPVLFDVFEVQLEHMIVSDVLFCVLLTSAVLLLCWSDKPPVLITALAGLLTGYAALVRSVGEPLLVIIVIGMVARRMGWRRIAATVVAGLIPIAAYMSWYHASEGRYALNAGGGTFVYGRVQSFADCPRMDPSPGLRVLCDPHPLAARPNPMAYIWTSDTPLGSLDRRDNVNQFSPQIESLAGRFAELAIEKQPLDYAKVVAKGVLTTFTPSREGVGQNDDTGSGPQFRFERTVWPVPGWVTASGVYGKAARDFGGASYGRPSVVQPWARFLWLYQHVYLHGPLLALFLLAGFPGVVAFWRRRRGDAGPGPARHGWGGLGLLPWLTGITLLVLPVMAVGFNYRYTLPTVPPLCLAAGLAFAGRATRAVPSGRWRRSSAAAARELPSQNYSR